MWIENKKSANVCRWLLCGAHAARARQRTETAPMGGGLPVEDPASHTTTCFARCKPAESVFKWHNQRQWGSASGWSQRIPPFGTNALLDTDSRASPVLTP